MTPPRACLLGLPAELRLRIYELLFTSLVVQVERGRERFRTEYPSDTRSDGEDESDNEDELVAEEIEEHERPSRGLSLLPGTPQEVLALCLTCKQIASEVDDNWHSQVCYHFPSTAAFIDVLSQWSVQKVRALRRVHAVDTPLPLYAHPNPGFYVTHSFHEALSLFPGLQLDTLTVRNIWLEPGGRPMDALGEFATAGTVKRLLSTQGWQRLEYMSGILPFSPTQMAQLDTVVENYRLEKQEPDFRYGLGRVRPRVYMRESLLDRSEGPEAASLARAAVHQWYADNVSEPPLRHDHHYLDDVHELHLAMWAHRGANARYVEDGAAVSSTLESLKNHLSQSGETSLIRVAEGWHARA